MADGPLGDDDPPFEQIHYWLGQCYYLQGNRDEARRAWQTARDFNPDQERIKKALDQLK
jgi:TolA-binding protein